MSRTGIRQNSHQRPQQTSAPARALPDTTVLTAAGLTKGYSGVLAVDDLSFSLAPGTVTGFLGPNGAGKTTTLRLLLGLAKPTAGAALIFGRPYQQLERPTRRVGAVLESSDFHPGRSGKDHLRVLAAAAAIPPARVTEVLEVVGLASAGGQVVKTYSLGMRQRLGLAGALLGEPELLVLDEPANGLDPAGVQWLRSLLRSFADAGGTVVWFGERFGDSCVARSFGTATGSRYETSCRGSRTSRSFAGRGLSTRNTRSGSKEAMAAPSLAHITFVRLTSHEAADSWLSELRARRP